MLLAGGCPYACPMTEELRAEFDRMPTTEVDLEEEVNDLLDKANNVMCQNENVMSEYEARCKRISELERTFTGESSKLSSARQKIEGEKKETAKCAADGKTPAVLLGDIYYSGAR